MIFEQGLDFLAQLDLTGFLTVFWFWALFDLPRYVLDIVPITAMAIYSAFARRFSPDFNRPGYSGPVSIVLAGHNEAHVLRQSVIGLRDQTHKEIQSIVVSDGSTDGMEKVAQGLLKEGLIDVALSTPLRAGKSAAVNLGIRFCDHEVIVNMDIDTSLDRDAIEMLIRPFADPKVGGVAGNIGVRNVTESLLTRLQAIEYLESIALGRRFTSMANILPIVSGGYGAFRKSALTQVGDMSVGPGEDADVTDKIRRAGWDVRFAHRSWALTDAPANLDGFVRQRLRWDRDILRLRLRKFGDNLNPFSRRFSLANALEIINILLFEVVLTFAVLTYLGWIFISYGELAPILLAMVTSFYLVEDIVEFMMVCILYPERNPGRLWPYIVGASIFRGYVMPAIRFVALVDDMMFRSSYRDSYVPQRVLDQATRF